MGKNISSFGKLSDRQAACRDESTTGSCSFPRKIWRSSLGEQRAARHSASRQLRQGRGLLAKTTNQYGNFIRLRHRRSFDHTSASGERSVIQRHCDQGTASVEWPEMTADRSAARFDGTGGARQKRCWEDPVSLHFALRELNVLRKLLKRQETQIEILTEAIDYARSLIDGIEDS
jgi:hypothetical protein